MKNHKKIKLNKKINYNTINKLPQEIKTFERLLKKIGYYDNSPIIKNVQRSGKKILSFYAEKYNIEIIGFIYYYPNKKSYLWRCYKELISRYSKKEILNYLKIICKGTLFLEKTRIAEVGWEILNSHNLLTKSKKDLSILYFQILRDIRTLLKKEFLEIKPRPGDILISRPRGLKFGLYKIDTDWEGSRQRGISSQKMFNFGKVNEFGDQYARYDENLNLHPT